MPLCLFALPKMRGAERRQALVRIRRTRGPPRGRADLRIAGDRPAHDAGRARLSALCGGSRQSLSVLPQLRSALACPGERVRAVSELLAQGP